MSQYEPVPYEPVKKKPRTSGPMVSFTKTYIDLYPTSDRPECQCDITFTPSSGMVTLDFRSHNDLMHIIEYNRLEFFIQHELIRLIRQGFETELSRPFDAATVPGPALDTAAQTLLLLPEQGQTPFEQYKIDKSKAQKAYKNRKESDQYEELSFFLYPVPDAVALYVVKNLSSHYKDFASVAHQYEANLYSMEVLDELGDNQETTRLAHDVKMFYQQFVTQYCLTYFACTKLDFTTLETALFGAHELPDVYPFSKDLDDADAEDLDDADAEDVDDDDKRKLRSTLSEFLAGTVPEKMPYGDSMLGAVLEYYVLRGNTPRAATGPSNISPTDVSKENAVRNIGWMQQTTETIKSFLVPC